MGLGMVTQDIKIIAHRGFWREKADQNSLQAFKDAFDNGYGIETDIRDYNGSIIISHDIPRQNTFNNITLDEMIKLYLEHGRNECLALNIKSDGMSADLMKTLNSNNIKNYFLFDLSMPNLIYSSKNFSTLNIYGRHSEYENGLLLKDLNIKGLWLDQFSTNFISAEILAQIGSCYSEIAIVSPELHGKAMDKVKSIWGILKKFAKESQNISISLCTDLPREASEFFNV